MTTIAVVHRTRRLLRLLGPLAWLNRVGPLAWLNRVDRRIDAGIDRARAQHPVRSIPASLLWLILYVCWLWCYLVVLGLLGLLAYIVVSLVGWLVTGSFVAGWTAGLITFFAVVLLFGIALFFTMFLDALDLIGEKQAAIEREEGHRTTPPQPPE